MRKVLLVCAFVLGSVATVVSWQQSSDPITVSKSPLKTPNGAQPATGRAVSGHLGGDLLPDVVMIRGGKIEVLFDPDLYDASMTMGLNPVDFDLGADANGDDAIFAADGVDGLQSWQLSGAAFAATTIDANETGVTIVRVGDVDGDGTDDVVGYGSSPSRVIVWRDPLGTNTKTSFTLPESCTDVAVLNFDGGSDLEIALLGQTGLAFYDWNGTFVDFFTLRHSFADIEVLSQTGQNDRLLAVYTPLTGTDQYVRIADSSGLGAAVALGSLGVVAATTGDLDADGDDDVILTRGLSSDVQILMNQRTASSPNAVSFDTNPSYNFAKSGLGSTPTNANASNAVICDLDGDGDNDAAVPAREDDRLVKLYNEDISQTDQMPRPDAIFWESDNGDPATVDLTLALTDAFQVPTAATNLEIVLWHRPGSGDTAPTAAKRYWMSIEYSNAIPAYQLLHAVPNNDPDVIYYWSMRYVELADPVSSTTDVLRVWPARILGMTFAVDDGSGPPAALQNLLDWAIGDVEGLMHVLGSSTVDDFYQGTNPRTQTYFEGAVTGTPVGQDPIETEDVGSVVEQKPVVEYPDEKEPKPDTSTENKG